MTANSKICRGTHRSVVATAAVRNVRYNSLIIRSTDEGEVFNYFAHFHSSPKNDVLLHFSVAVMSTI